MMINIINLDHIRIKKMGNIGNVKKHIKKYKKILPIMDRRK